MTVPPETFLLAADFPAATAQQWRELTLQVARRAGLAGAESTAAEVDELLSTVDDDGIAVAPLHTAPVGVATGLPGLFPFTRGGRPAGPTRDGWDVRARHADPDPKATRTAVLADLENGATSLWLVVGDGGLPVQALPEALDGVHLDLAGIVLDAGRQTAEAVDAWFALVDARGLPLDRVSANLGWDPLADHGRQWADPGEALLRAAGTARRCAAQAPAVRSMTVDATVYHDAGGSAAEEIGCALATGLAYLRALTDDGLDLAQAFGQLEFRFAATADQFATIAKLRAARRTWARIAEVCGQPDLGAQRQHVVTSSAMMTARDPWVNMLRTTLACFAAGVGGADAVTVHPFDLVLGASDAAARRLARNTQSLLLDEANVGRVADPAGGSWYVEQLTDDTAHSAWAWFTEIERAGGMAAALSSGLVAERVAGTWQRRRGRIARRKAPITGVSEFPNLTERLPQRSPAPARPETGGLPRHRYAEDFERLRDRADAAAGSTGTRPTVFLAALGPPAAHAARVGFATNLLAAGGIAATTGSGDSPAELATAFAASGCTVACICSSDARYAEEAAALAGALAQAGARAVWLAGRPADHASVTGYLFAGCDAIEVLTTLLDELEVA